MTSGKPYGFFLFCFVFVFFGRWNKLKLTLFKDPLHSLWRFSSAHKKKWKGRWFIDRNDTGVGLGLVTALRFTRALSNGPEKQKEKRLDIKHLLRWELSSLPVHGVDSRCWRQCTLPGHVSQEPFHSYEVHRHLVNRAINDILHKNKGKIFPICLAPYPPKSPTGPF